MKNRYTLSLLQNSVSFAEALAISRLKAAKYAFFGDSFCKTSVLQKPPLLGLFTMAALIILSMAGCDSSLDGHTVFGIYRTQEINGASMSINFVSLDGKNGGFTFSFNHPTQNFPDVPGYFSVSGNTLNLTVPLLGEQTWTIENSTTLRGGIGNLIDPITAGILQIIFGNDIRWTRQ